MWINYRPMNLTLEQRRIRVFFALWPTAAERDQLAAWLAPLHRLYGGRTLRGETLHNTLVFIGEVPQDDLASLQVAAQEVRNDAFELCLDEARYWGHNHIVYAAPSQPPPQLARLASTLARHLDKHGIKFDQRGYQPHVTLLRNARRTDPPLPALPPVCWQISEFALMQSLNQEGKTNYRVLATFPLHHRPADAQQAG